MTKLLAENTHPADASIIRLLLQLRNALTRRGDYESEMGADIYRLTIARGDGVGRQFAADEQIADIAILLQAWTEQPLLEAPPRKDWRPVTIHNIVNGGAA